MRFVFGPIPQSSTVDASGDQWTPMTSTNDIKSWRYATVVMMLALMVAAFLALQQAAFTPDINPWRLVAVLALSPLLIPLHECAHCIGYFVSFRSQNLITGICPTLGAWYVIYDAPLPRWRVLVMLISPLVLLSIFPCIAIANLDSMNAWLLAFLILFHSGLCIGDMVTFVRIYTNVPAGSIVHNRGWTTCWTRQPEAAHNKSLDRSR